VLVLLLLLSLLQGLSVELLCALDIALRGRRQYWRRRQSESVGRGVNLQHDP
jgi:hypothetical protein